MKAKVKLDLGTVKKWLLEHGEKAAFSLIVLVFLMFIWYAIQREVLDASKQPDVLEQQASAVRMHVEQSTWDPTREGVAVIDYASKAKRQTLAVATYGHRTAFNIPTRDPKTKRDDPQLFGVEDLRVAAGFSIFALKGEAKEPTAGLAAEPWVVITGLVPVKKQREEYARVFTGAMAEDPKRDRPQYLGYLVERTEIDPSDPTKVKWERMPRPDARAKQWEGNSDIVAKDFIDSTMTKPLPNLAGGATWDESVAHPKVPLAGEADRSKTPPKAESDEPPKAEEAPADEMPFSTAQGRRAAEKPTETRGDNESREPAEIAYKLLRVFDYSVQPEKHYRYRVTLGLEDPNYAVPKHCLKDPDKKRNEFAQAPTSEPTPVVTIPTGSRVLAAGRGKRYRPDDPVAEIIASRINPEEGMEVAAPMEVRRGSVANFSAPKLAVRAPGGAVKELTNVEIKTDMLVLDIHGGQPLSTRRNAPHSPVEVLVLDPQGNLSVHNELAEQRMVADRRVPDEPEEKKEDLLKDDSKSKAKSKARDRDR